jgi:formylglycine-generating enzyme required for sulfatase activity
MLSGDVPLEMVWVPGGFFLMGSPNSELDHEVDEAPQHMVLLTSRYWMGRDEVTKRQWIAVMGGVTREGQPFVKSYPESPAVYPPMYAQQHRVSSRPVVLFFRL